MSEYENQMWRNSLITNIPTEFCGHSLVAPGILRKGEFFHFFRNFRSFLP